MKYINYNGSDEKLIHGSPESNICMISGWTQPHTLREKVKDSLYNVIGGLVNSSTGVEIAIANIRSNPHITCVVCLSFTHMDKNAGNPSGLVYETLEKLGYEVYYFERPEVFLQWTYSYVPSETHELLLEAADNAVRPDEPIILDLSSQLQGKQDSYIGRTINHTSPEVAWISYLEHIIDRGVWNYDHRRLEIFDTLVVIPWSPGRSFRGVLEETYKSQDSLRGVLDTVLTDDLPEGVSYTYGSRISKLWGVHSLSKLEGSQSVISLWEPKDYLSSDPPCLMSIYLRARKGHLDCSFLWRAQTIFSSWLPNFRQMEAIQRKLCGTYGLKPGAISIHTVVGYLCPYEVKEVEDLIRANKKTNYQMDREGYFKISFNGYHDLVVTYCDTDRSYVEERIMEVRYMDREILKLKQEYPWISDSHLIYLTKELYRAIAEGSPNYVQS